ncbi:beta strand repeat-containing protein [Ferruginibacter albus]|uniref:beta strand repeat-containing protein n=1 Tax=Ferruginibacter albus TaxID=2875540 RepID=UPI001CC45199|nr:hypothetical protein [Ferruginibacter albus]UAY50713.1 hypothetical protein K9M53_08905 [Ferruginibacter albus]
MKKSLPCSFYTNKLVFCVLFSLLCVTSIGVYSQTVFSDNFEGVTSGLPTSTTGSTFTTSSTPAITYTATLGSAAEHLQITSSGTNVLELGYTYPGTGSATAVADYATAPLSSYSSPFNTTLGSNTKSLIWTFNMRPNNTASGTFNTAGTNAKYSIATILCTTNSNASSFLSSGNGYAVMNITGSNSYGLYRFSGGVGGTPVNLLGSAFGAVTTTHYGSFKVVYNPTTNQWSFYVRDDGTSAFADPNAGSAYTLVGTATDNTYTSSAMSLFGFAWQHNTGGSTKVAYFDNFNCYVSRSCGGGTFTIDNSVGMTNTGTNYTSFNAAINDIISCSPITGPYTFNVKAGDVFNEYVTPLPNVGSSVSKPIVFQRSGSGNNPVINPIAGTGTTDAVINLNGCSYVTFDGIDIADLNTANNTAEIEYGYYITNSSTTSPAQNNTIKNCAVTLYRSNSNDPIGVCQTSAFTPSSSSNANSNNLYQNITVTNAYNGILLSGNTTNPDLNCEIKNCNVGSSSANDIGGGSDSAYGIKALNQSSVSIHDLEVKNVTSSSGTTGIQAYGIYLKNATGTSNVYNCSVHEIAVSKNSSNPSVSGIYVDVPSGSTVNVYNNFIYDILTNSSTSNFNERLLFTNGAGRVNVYYNSILANSNLTNITAACLYVNGNNVDIRNNIFKNTVSNSSNGYAYCIFINSGTILSTDYNIFDITTSSRQFIGGTPSNNYQALSAWTTYLAGIPVAIREQNSNNFTASFINTTIGTVNLHLSLFTANSLYKATPITTAAGFSLNISIDIDNQTRTNTTDNPLIGADEIDFAAPFILISGSNQPGDSSVSGGSVKQVLFGMNITAYNTNTTLTSLTVNTSGNFSTSSASDFGNFRLWYNSTNSLTGATQVTAAGATIANAPSTTSGALNFTFSGINAIPINSATTTYVFITDDIGASGVVPDSIRISSTPYSNFNFSSSVNLIGSGPLINSGRQTICHFYYNWGDRPNINDGNNYPDICIPSGWYDSLAHNPAPDFTSPNQIFRFISNNSTMSTSTWSVSGINSKIIVGDGANLVTFRVTKSFTGIVDVANKGTLLFVTSSIPTSGLTLYPLETGSTVNYSDSGTATTQTILPANYYDLVFSNPSGGGTRSFISGKTDSIQHTFTTSSSFTSASTGTISYDGTAIQTITPFTYYNLDINNSTGTTLSVAGAGTGTCKIAASSSVAVSNSMTVTKGNLIVQGNLNNSSTSTSLFAASVTSSTLGFANGGNYNFTGTTAGQIPAALWHANSNINVTNLSNPATGGLTAGTPGAAGYGNITFDNPSLNTNAYKLFGGFASSFIIQGNLTLGRIGTSSYIQMTTGTQTINVLGNVNHYAGRYGLNSYGTNEVINVSGNFIEDATYNFGNTSGTLSGYSAPVFALAMNGTGTGNTGTLNLAGNLTTTSGTNLGTGSLQIASIEHSASSATVNFTSTSAAQSMSVGSGYFCSDIAGLTATTLATSFNVTGAGGVNLTSDFSTAGRLTTTGGSFTINTGKTLEFTTATGSTAVTNIGTGTALVINGTYKNTTGGSTPSNPIANSGTLTIGANATYQNNVNGGTIPTPTSGWPTTSTVLFTGNVISGPSTVSLNQTFGNFTWNSTQTQNVSLAGPTALVIAGDMTVVNTGSSALRLASNVSTNISVLGNLVMNGGNMAISAGGTGNDTLTVSKNVTLTNASKLYLSQAGFVLTPTTGTGVLKTSGDFTTASGTLVTETSENSSSVSPANINAIIFTKSGSQIFDPTGFTGATDSIYYYVNNGSTVNLTSSSLTVNSGASITLNNGGIFNIGAHTLTINGIQDIGTGTYTGSGSSKIFIGGSNTGSVGTLYFTSGSQLLNSFTINRNSAAFVSLGTDLQINGGCALTSGTFGINGNTLTLNGTYSSGASNAGSLTGSATSNLVIGSSASSPALTFTYDVAKIKNCLNSIKLNASASLATGTTSSSLYIVGGTTTSPGTVNVVDGTSAVFATNDSLTLQSNNNGTARVAINKSVSTYISGKITVERYIDSYRAWRLLTTPLSTRGQTIKQAWQENSTNNVTTDLFNPVHGYGTEITNVLSTVPSATGYDKSATNNPSLMYMDVVAQKWKVPGRTDTTDMTTFPGYMIFIRGDRSVLVQTPPANTYTSTILRSKGTIKQGALPLTIGNGFNVIGNPYPSEFIIDSLITRDSPRVGQNYTVWDPKGGHNNVGYYTYLAFISPGVYSSWSVTPQSAFVKGRIESGQAFIMNGKSGTAHFLETDKATTSAMVFRPVNVTDVQEFGIQLSAVNPDEIAIVDGALALYGPQYSDGVNWLEDAQKIPNPGENISIIRDGKSIAIDKTTELTVTDTIYLSLKGTQQKTYQFAFASIGLASTGLVGILIDSFTGQRSFIPLTGDTTKVNFTVTANAASQAVNRFKIVFAFPDGGPLPVTFTTVNARKTNDDIKVQWNVQNELNIKQYIVEKSVDGNTFTAVATVKANGAIQYGWLDVQPSPDANYYRIRSVDNSGVVSYSEIVEVSIGNVKPASVTIYPNPVTTNVAKLKFENLPSGKYGLRLFNPLGQEIMREELTYNGGTEIKEINLDKRLAKGGYQLQIIKPNGDHNYINLLLQ